MNKTQVIKIIQTSPGIAEIPIERKRIYDVLEGPYRSYTSEFPNVHTHRQKLPDFQQVGFVYRNEKDPNYNPDDNNRLPLFSRQRYSGSNQYEYYTIANGIKIPISENRKEINEGEKLSLKGFEGEFNTSIYSTNDVRYNPWS